MTTNRSFPFSVTSPPTTSRHAQTLWGIFLLILCLFHLVFLIILNHSFSNHHSLSLFFAVLIIVCVIDRLIIFCSYISSNPLVSIPPSMGNMTRLNTAEFITTKLKTVPPEFASLRLPAVLKYLRIGEDFNLTVLPDNFGSLSALTYLALWGTTERYSPMNALPPSIANLRNLLYFGTARTSFTTIPPCVMQLPALTKLFVFFSPSQFCVFLLPSLITFLSQ